MRLQGISKEFKGVEASSLKIGDITIWNYGYKEEILEMYYSKSKKTINFKIKSLSNGSIHTRQLRATTLVVKSK